MSDRVARAWPSVFIQRFPVVAYVLLTFLITWSIWFTIPLVGGGDWTLMKILLGIGMGPGLAAIILDRYSGTGGTVDALWWRYFMAVFIAVVMVNLSSLFQGDALAMDDLPHVVPQGFSLVGITGVLLCAIVCGSVFAFAARSRRRSLNTICGTRASWKWSLIALFLPFVTALIGLAFSLLFGLEMPAPPYAELPIGLWAFAAVRAILFTLLVVSIGEETGWRGWMQPWLQRHSSPLITSLILGVVWGLWHFPLHAIGFYGGAAEDVLGQVILSPLLAILFTWIYNRSGGSLLPALLFHTSINNAGRILPSTDISFVLLILLAIAVVFTDKMWRKVKIASEVPEATFGKDQVPKPAYLPRV